MKYTPPPIWMGEELLNLFTACENCLMNAERCNDKMFLHYLRHMMDLIMLRLPLGEVVEVENLHDT